MAKWPFPALISRAKLWLAETRNSQQEDQERLSPLPTLWLAALRRRLGQWPVPDAYLTTTQQRLLEAVTAWQQDPDAANSLVILSSPVEETTALVQALVQGEGLRNLPQAVAVRHPMAWHLRPANPLNLADQFSHALADIQEKTAQDDDDCPDPLAARRSLIVMPPLEQCFLRCIGGWKGVEWLRDTVGHYPEYFWVIRCNTWAWAFLNRICQVETYFSETVLLPELDKAMLTDWLLPFAADLVATPPDGEDGDADATAAATDDSKDSPADHRSSPQADDATDDSRDDPAPDPRLDWIDQQGWSWSDLASLSQGQAAVARYLWLRSLRLREEDCPDQPQPLGAAGPLPVSLQLLPATLPGLPSLTTDDHYILHALMLHGVITRSHLAQSLGLAESLVEVTVQRLRRAGMLRQTRQGISLDPAYYPQVLAELKSNNFLVGEDE